MPEKPDDKFRPRVTPEDVSHLPASELFYAELAVTTNFSFLRGASHAEELVIEAKRLGHAALAVADHGTLSGIVRAHVAAKEAGLPLVVGARVGVRVGWDLEGEARSQKPEARHERHEGTEAQRHKGEKPETGIAIDLILLPQAKGAYARMCEMLTRGKRRTEKGQCDLSWVDLEEFAVDERGGPTAWQGILVPPDVGAWPGMWRVWRRALEEARGLFAADHLSVLVTRHYRPNEAAWLARVLEVCRDVGVPPVVGNDVLYHTAERRMLQDVLTCIREGCVIDQAGRRLEANGERHLKSPEEMWRLFADMPAAFARVQTVAQRALNFSLDQLTYEYPHEICPPGKTQQQHLRELTYQRAAEKFSPSENGVRPRFAQLSARLEHELTLIEELKYAPYFLTVYDIVQFARSRGILCQGRGAAANSAVCFCLGITNVDPTQIDLLVERFISKERNEPPDIDIDFEHERREEVIQYIYERYGRHRAALCAEVITYRRRSAVRDVGKALGFSLDAVDRLAKSHDWWTKVVAHEETLRAMGFDPHAPAMRLLVKLASEILGFPRHLSQHVGGFVITEGPLWNMVPVENAAMPDRTVIEWDKDDIDAMGMLKIDVLGLGMLTAIRKAFDLIEIEATEAWGELEAQRHKGTEAQRGNEATNQLECELKPHGTIIEAQRSSYGHDQHVSGSGGLAEGNGVNAADLSLDGKHAGGGTVWPDQPDAARGGVSAEQHCRGVCAAEPARLHQIFEDSPRFAGGVGDAGGACGVDGNAQAATDDSGLVARGRSHHSGADHESREKEKVNDEAALCASVPLCLCAFNNRPLALDNLPLEDPCVYDMLCRADSVGVFQVESRAQMSMLPRLKPRCYYDLVIEVAIVRPGPIQGGMVHPYLRRRNGEEAVTYPNEDIKKVLGRTLGVPLFQEQVMRLAMVAAGFTGGQADQLRRAMAAWKRKGHLIEKFVRMIIGGMLARGYTQQFADQLCNQIHGFGEYGFPESHAASFAHLVYASAWLKCYHPAAFCAALINSQPMGFYQPAQLIRDAQQHGVKVRPIDVNWSGWDCTLEKEETHRHKGTETQRHRGTEGPALRLGFRLVRGVREVEVAKIVRAVKERGAAFRDVLSLWRASGVKVATLKKLAAADAFNSMGLDRQHALWQVQALRDVALPLLDGREDDEGTEAQRHRGTEVVKEAVLPVVAPSRLVIHDYAATGLSLKGHPLAFVREKLLRLGLKTCGELHDRRTCPDGSRVGVAGLVLVRQRPGTASGILFVTLEDETGAANLVVRPHIYEHFKHHIRHAIALAVWGHVERGGPDKNVLHLIVRKAVDVNCLHEPGRALPVRSASRDFH